MSTFEQSVLWTALPYASFVLLVAGLVWRYRTDQFGWTSRSSQWHESRILRWASPLFHFGILFVAAGHVMGLGVPKSFTEAAGVPEHVYHLMAVIPGTIAGVMTIIGLGGLLYRRFVVKSVRLATTRNDKIMYVLLLLPICLGAWATISTQLMGGLHGGYDYRETISPWFRSIFMLRPRAEIMAAAPAKMAPWEDRSVPLPMAASHKPRNHAETSGRLRRAGANDPPRAPEFGLAPEWRGAVDVSTSSAPQRLGHEAQQARLRVGGAGALAAHRVVELDERARRGAPALRRPGQCGADAIPPRVLQPGGHPPQTGGVRRGRRELARQRQDHLNAGSRVERARALREGAQQSDGA